MFWCLDLWFFMTIFFNPVMRKCVLMVDMDLEQDTWREAPPLRGGAMHVAQPSAWRWHICPVPPPTRVGTTCSYHLAGWLSIEGCIWTFGTIT